MNKDEVLQQALEALNKLTDVFLDTEGNHGDYEQKALNQGNKAILAIKKALAQPEQGYPKDFIHALAFHTALSDLEPEQEPVAKVVSSGEYDFPMLQWISANHSLDTAIGSLLYTSPPQRQPLTEEQLDVLALDNDGLPNSHFEFARAIEAAHGIGDKT